jgi:ATP-dependent protease ClpP protease subunit
LSGTVASIATIIALACDSIEVADYIQFMIHNYSSGASGKGHEMKAQMDFTDAELNKAFSEIYAGFLTNHEMELVIAGKDLWMGKSELLSRYAARENGDTEALVAIEAARKAK